MDKLRILILEDNAADVELLERELKRGEINHVSKRVMTREAFEKEIMDFKPDLILADYSLPQFNAMEALLILETKGLAYIPFIIVTGTVKEEIAEKCVGSGAWDYVIKDHIMRLSTSAKAAMARREAEKKRDEALARLDELNKTLLGFGEDFDANINSLVRVAGELLNATCALYNRLDKGMLCSLGRWNTPPDYDPVDNPDGHICYDVIKKGGDEVFVVTDLPGTPYAKTDPNVSRYSLKTYVGKAVRGEDGYVGSVCVVYQNDFMPSEEDEDILGIIAAAISVEEKRKGSENRLKESEEKFRVIFDDAADGILLADAKSMKFLFGNTKICQMLGYGPEEIKDLGVLDVHPEGELRKITEGFEKQVRKEIGVVPDAAVKRKDGSVFYADINSRPVTIGGKTCLMGIFRDVTARRNNEEKLKDIIEELRRYKDVTVGRENKMIELKKEINKLSRELGRPEPYDVAFAE